MTRRAGWVVGGLGGLCLLLLIWVAGSGPVPMLHAPQATFAPPTGGLPTPLAPTPTPTGSARPRRPLPPPIDLRWLGVLLLVLVCVAALAGAIAVAVWLWRHRWHRPQRPVEADVDALPAVARSVTADAEAQLATLEEGEPRNAIVACWLRLEEAVAAAGIVRDPSETSAELTARVLAGLAVDPGMFGGLAALYREARFSRHPMGEDKRRAALAALRSLHDDLDAAVPPAAASPPERR